MLLAVILSEAKNPCISPEAPQILCSAIKRQTPVAHRGM
jgi:hypothetical protein